MWLVFAVAGVTVNHIQRNFWCISEASFQCAQIKPPIASGFTLIKGFWGHIVCFEEDLGSSSFVNPVLCYQLFNLIAFYYHFQQESN